MQPPHLGKSKTADAVHIRFRFGSVPQTHQVSMTLFSSCLFLCWLHPPAIGMAKTCGYQRSSIGSTHRPRVWPPKHRPRAWQRLHSHGFLHMEDPQGGVGRLAGADDGEDSLVWLDACVRGPVPRLRQAPNSFGPVVVRNQSWFRRGSIVAPVLFSFGS